MTIGIDLNDVIRNFTVNFAKYYKQGYDHTFEYDDFEIWTHNLDELFTFKSEGAYNKFTYTDYAYELFGACPTCELKTTSAFNDWVTKIIPNIDSNENIDLVIISPKEANLSIPSTMFFISKIGCKIREVFLPQKESELWDKCDLIITANPDIINLKPDNEKKTVVKITTDYNKEVASDYEFSSFIKFAGDESNIKNIIKERYEK